MLHTINPRLHPDLIAWIANHAEDQVLCFDMTFLPLVQALHAHCKTVTHYVALCDAIAHCQRKGLITDNPVTGRVAAVSVGVYQGLPVLDLDYAEDSQCDTDMNVVMDGKGGFIELQGTAEGEAFSREHLNALLGLAGKGIDELLTLQQSALDA